MLVSMQRDIVIWGGAMISVIYLNTLYMECFIHTHLYMSGDPQNWYLFIKSCVFLPVYTSVTFKVRSIWCSTPIELVFSHCSEQCLTSSILLPFRASAIVCFVSSTLAQNFPLRTFFSSGETKKVTQGEIVLIGRMGHGSQADFGQKLLNTQRGVGRCAHKSPIMKWANVLEESSKKFTEAELSLSQQRQLVHWYRWVLRILT